jgi:hypothetical protein
VDESVLAAVNRVHRPVCFITTAGLGDMGSPKYLHVAKTPKGYANVNAWLTAQKV